MTTPPNLIARTSTGPSATEVTLPALGIGPAVDRLERLFTDGDLQKADLAALGDPQRLDLLFKVLLGTLLRRGPKGEADALSIGALLAGAAFAAAHGLAPLAAPVQLRRDLESLDDSLRGADAWRRDALPWWEPLPPPSLLEDLWGQLGRTGIHLPEPEPCGASLGRNLYETLPGLLTPSWCRKVHQQLEAAWVVGKLALEPGAVGASGRISSRRSDLVLYLTGLEQEVLDEAPAFATLVQWGLQNLEGFLRRALPGRPIFAPQRAMLTRYPAPSGGYEVHIDNPKGRGEGDNGRELTLVLYLNAPERECSGGELTLWKGPALGEPAATVEARAGNAALFDSRAIPHQVRPLREGPYRWALTFWFSDAPQHPPAPMPPPLPNLTELLLPVEDPPLHSRRILFHQLDPPGAPALLPAPRRATGVVGEILVHAAGTAAVRPGIVTTVYRGGPLLETWCEHHLSMGFVHLLLVFDHLEEKEEAALADRLRCRYSRTTLTIWPGQVLAEEGWPSLGENEKVEQLRSTALGGGSSTAHAARQALNASVALEQARGDALGGAPLDWLLHLDADELFFLQGRGRGGADAQEHFSTARSTGVRQVRYLNHELLLPHHAGQPPRFKVNPRLAAARLGANGWLALVRHLAMEQTAPRPYFRAYHNGKAAVTVDAAQGAAGVHGWQMDVEAGSTGSGRETVLAGPSILHLHLPTADCFRKAYLTKASLEKTRAESSGKEISKGPRLFTASPLEAAALKCARFLEGASSEELAEALDSLYRQKTFFESRDAKILAEAGLLLTPRLPALSAWTPG